MFWFVYVFELTRNKLQFVTRWKHLIRSTLRLLLLLSSQMSGESRTDLLNWLNATLNLNYTKVEQLGTGAAYCQILDSIYLDVPMGKVKFDATKEYEYLNNFKVLQSSFLKHKISKTIPVERLIKCKFQDNLEFFQWVRKFWKENKDESEYDSNSRRKYMPPANSNSNSTRPSRSSSAVALNNGASVRRSVSSSSSNSTSGVLPRASSRIGSTSSKPTSRVSSLSNGNAAINAELQNELNATKTRLAESENELLEYKTAVDALETERNFYFNKLREIEILTESTSDLLKDESTVEQHPSLKEILLKVQEILYTTEEGFQVPDDITEAQDINMEEETF
ncbi:unnamed protein product [Wickerhamomyces anomalus]